MTTITDYEIKKQVADGKLISSDFSSDCLKQCCYEIRSSNTFHIIGRDVEKVTIDDGSDFILRAHEKAVFISFEKFNIPPDYLGRILTKGVLFSLGISAVNTYADPGFRGHLGITLHNTSPYDIKFPFRSPIAKIEFEKLDRSVEEPYAGQHGYSLGLWPFPKDRIVTHAKGQSIEAISSHLTRVMGSGTGDLYLQLKRVQRNFALVIFIGLIFNAVILGLFHGETISSTSSVIVSSIITNCIFLALSWWIGKEHGSK
jgi:dCTP deaminase